MLHVYMADRKPSKNVYSPTFFKIKRGFRTDAIEEPFLILKEPVSELFLKEPFLCEELITPSIILFSE